MKKFKDLLTLEKNGEFSYNGLNSYIKSKYKADSPFEYSFVPYIIMLFCCTVDLMVFLNMIKMLSYEAPLILATQTCALLFAFDVVPIYLGTHLKKIKLGLTKDKLVLWCAIVVCILGVAVNTSLRIMTMDIMAPDLSDNPTSYYNNHPVESTTTESEDEEENMTAISIAVMGICVPIITSLGSFFVSYSIADPLKNRKRRLEKALSEKSDEIRRLNALLFEYESYEDFAEHLKENDHGKFEEMKKMDKALVVEYCEYVRQRLKEYLGDPTSNNILSEETCIAILERLDREIAALNWSDNQLVSSSEDKVKTIPVSKTAV